MAASGVLESKLPARAPGAFTVEPTRSSFAASRTALLALILRDLVG